MRAVDGKQEINLHGVALAIASQVVLSDDGSLADQTAFFLKLFTLGWGKIKNQKSGLACETDGGISRGRRTRGLSSQEKLRCTYMYI